MALDPSFSILCGDLKAGKTSDALSAFPRAVYVAAPGALSPAETVWGFEAPARYDLETFADVRKFSEGLTPAHLALVIDDATLIADRTAGYLSREKSLGGWELWGAVLLQAIHLRDTLRRRGIHIVFTAHLRTAHMENGVRVKGGPSFQGQCATKVPAAADLLLRAEARGGGGGGDAFGGAGSNGALGWPMVYRTAPSPDWFQGSRYNTPDMSPMNLREILNLAGFRLPRLPGLEWQEPVAEQLAQRLIAVGLTEKEKVSEAIKRVRDYCYAKFTKNRRHVDWAIRDGYDRAILRIADSKSGLWGG